MSKKKLNENERKIKFSVSISSLLFNKINEIHSNKSKYIEHLILNDMIDKNLINKSTLI